jgi:hypothetical protein
MGAVQMLQNPSNYSSGIFYSGMISIALIEG